MFVSIDLHGSAQPELAEPTAFDAFKVVVDGEAAGDRAAVADALAACGWLDESGDAFVSIDRLLELAGDHAASQEWRAQFEQMVAFARKHGWLDESGAAIRAHIEYLG